MAIALYLAQTYAEFSASNPPPAHMAWMACHFSPYGTGLTNLPKSLPKDSLLILNDCTPISGHDADVVCQTLWQTVQQWECRGILLDFQRPNSHEAAKIIKELLKLSCPVAVSDLYAKGLSCPVFLSSPPLNKSLAEHIKPWQGRTIWLEAALECAQIAVTESGCCYTPQPYSFPPDSAFYDEVLHCHYHTDVSPNAVRFHLYRTREDLQLLLQEAEAFGISRGVGLYQQLQE